MTDKQKTDLFLIILGIITILFSFYLFDTNSIYCYFLTYLGIVFITFTIPDNKFINWIKFIILLPTGVLAIIGPLLKVLIVFFLAYLLPLMLFAIFYKLALIYFFNVDLSYASNVYLTLISTLIFITLFSEKLMIWFNDVFNGNNPEKLINLYQNLGFFLINKQRTRYFIFFGFFLYLIIFSIASLNEINLFDTKNINVAIMQTFGTYIAFDRLITNRNLFEFKPKTFLQKMSKIWVFEFNPSIERVNDSNKND